MLLIQSSREIMQYLRRSFLKRNSIVRKDETREKCADLPSSMRLKGVGQHYRRLGAYAKLATYHIIATFLSRKATWSSEDPTQEPSS